MPTTSASATPVDQSAQGGECRRQGQLEGSIEQFTRAIEADPQSAQAYYAAMSLPGVQEAVDERDWERARSQLALLTERFQRMGWILRRAGTSLRCSAELLPQGATHRRQGFHAPSQRRKIKFVVRA